MTSQVEILKEEWLEKGYEISSQDSETVNKEVIVIRLQFYRLDSKPIVFVDEWNQIKELANRQSFYAFPIIEKWRFNQARILLVKNESIDRAFIELTDHVEKLQNTYWGRQRDEDITALIKKTQRLQFLALSVHVGLNAKQSVSEETFLKSTEAYENWKALKSEMGMWCLYIWDSEKIDETLKGQMYKTANRFGF